MKNQIDNLIIKQLTGIRLNGVVRIMNLFLKMGNEIKKKYNVDNYYVEEFRDNYKQNKDMIVSKKYQKTQLQLSKLHREISRKRENYNHNITTKIINSYSFIGVETLNITGMFRNRHLSFLHSLYYQAFLNNYLIFHQLFQKY